MHGLPAVLCPQRTHLHAATNLANVTQQLKHVSGYNATKVVVLHEKHTKIW
jgi:hypothetical protein